MRYDVRLLRKDMVGGVLMLFRLERPKAFQFLAGQFCTITLPSVEVTDNKELRSGFSIASAPFERELIFATRLSDSPFKKALRDMAAESAVTIDGPFGSFTLPEDTSNPIIFLAGGLGVTPFRSMMKYVADSSTGHRVTLFYSSRVLEEAVFLDELQGLADTRTNIKLVATMTRPEQSSTNWTGLTGRLNAAMIKERCDEWPNAMYYMAGPPAMVDTMQQILDDMAIPGDRVRTEKWGV
ncbi:MAG: FAD-dependent oxidoreductase [Syntrophorhabdales bacterium]|jgi:ferredoxin-NADP reductase